MGYEKCKAGVIKAKTLTECTNERITPSGINGPVVVKIPVVLAEPNVQIDVEALIELEEPAIEIKRIRKTSLSPNVKL